MVKIYGAGVFCCVNCEGKLFDSSTQYDLGIGWPTFSAPIHWKNGGTVAVRYIVYTNKSLNLHYCNLKTSEIRIEMIRDYSLI